MVKQFIVPSQSSSQCLLTPMQWLSSSIFSMSSYTYAMVKQFLVSSQCLLTPMQWSMSSYTYAMVKQFLESSQCLLTPMQWLSSSKSLLNVFLHLCNG